MPAHQYTPPRPKTKYASKPKTPREVLRLRVIEAACKRDGDTAGALAAAEEIKLFYLAMERKALARAKAKIKPKPARTTLRF